VLWARRARTDACEKFARLTPAILDYEALAIGLTSRCPFLFVVGEVVLDASTWRLRLGTLVPNPSPLL